MPSTDPSDTRADVRDRIVAAASAMLTADGPVAVTTRAVAQAAGVQPPTIYRLFGDKDGLLEAVAEHVMAEFVARKATEVASTAGEVDPVDDLRHGWRRQVEFGLAHPALHHLFSDPDRVSGSEAARQGRRILAERVRRVAATGRLRVDESRAADMLTASSIGVIRVLLATPGRTLDDPLVEHAYDALAREILIDAPSTSDAVLTTTTAFRSVVPYLDELSDAERTLLCDWLDRVVDGRASSHS
ncbi:TetR/AcrR family transcriptional regulator [Williamsia sp. SKLECPSW1]